MHKLTNNHSVMDALEDDVVSPLSVLGELRKDG